MLSISSMMLSKFIIFITNAPFHQHGVNCIHMSNTFHHVKIFHSVYVIKFHPQGHVSSIEFGFLSVLDSIFSCDVFQDGMDG